MLLAFDGLLIHGLLLLYINIVHVYGYNRVTYQLSGTVIVVRCCNTGFTFLNRLVDVSGCCSAPTHIVLGGYSSEWRRRRRRRPPPVAMTCAPVLNTEIGKSVDKDEVFVVVVIVIDCRTIL